MSIIEKVELMFVLILALVVGVPLLFVLLSILRELSKHTDLLPKRTDLLPAPRTVTRSPEEVIFAAASLLVDSGFVINSQSATTLSATRQRRPHADTGCALGLLGVVPALVYMNSGGKTQTVLVRAISTPAGTQIEVSGNDGQVVQGVKRHLKRL